MQRKRLLLSTTLLIAASGFLFLASMAHAAFYAPGSTLDPSCLPTDPTCGIASTTYSNGVAYNAGNVTNTGLLSITPQSGATITGALTIASSTSGTDLSITSSGSTLTFNLPNASASSRGLLSAADWTTFNAKQAALTFASSTAVMSAQSSEQIVSWGDSLTAGAGTTIPYTTVVSSLLGYPDYNEGVPGQTSLQIGVREGGVPTTVTVTGGQIPATGSVTITFATGYEPITTSGPAGGVTGTIAGVHGSVTFSNSTYTFTPTNATTTVSVSGSVPFTMDTSEEYLNAYQVIWSGENDANNPTEVEVSIAGMVANFSPNTNYLIMSILNNSTCIIGTSCYTNVTTLNNYLAATYPGHYFDIREYLVQHGLSDAGITPSQQDLTDISNDTIPTDLHSDTVHLNTAGYQVVGQQVAKFIENSGFNSSSTGYVLTTNNAQSLLDSPNILGTLTQNGLQMLYNATTNGFSGSLFFGNGGGSLSNTGGGQAGYFDTGVGYNAMLNNTTGSYNTALGYDALEYSASSTGNTAVGVSTLVNASGSNNTALGLGALEADTFGSANTAIGQSSALFTATGTNNTSVGYWSLYYNTSGSDNLALGSVAMFGNTTGSNNVAIGYGALYTATSTVDATAVGFNALRNLLGTGGVGNGDMEDTAIGSGALSADTSATFNTAVGDGALANATTGGGNVAVGGSALHADTTGSNNAAFGGNATLSANTTGSYNVALGYDALNMNTTGSNNTAVGGGTSGGAGPLAFNTTGSSNTALGELALVANTSGSNNTALGYAAARENVSATGTVAVGYAAAQGGTGNGVAYYNQGGTYVGWESGLLAQTDSDYNTFFGYKAGYDVLTGNDNIIIGPETSTGGNHLTTGMNNIGIGYNIVFPGGASSTNQLNIGNFIFGTGLTATSSSTSIPTTLTGYLGVGTSSPYSRLTLWGPDTSVGTAALTIANSASTTEFQVFDNGSATLAGTLTQNSDQRLKTNVQPLDASSTLQNIMSLNPVAYNWIDTSDGTGQQLGFIAQAVQKVFPQLVSTTSATALTPGGTLGVNYIGLIAPIVESIKELGTEVNNLAQAVTTQILTATTVKTQNLCVGSTCITQQQLQILLQQSGQTSAVVSTPSTPTAPTSNNVTPAPSSTSDSSDTSTSSSDSGSSDSAPADSSSGDSASPGDSYTSVSSYSNSNTGLGDTASATSDSSDAATDSSAVADTSSPDSDASASAPASP